MGIETQQAAAERYFKLMWQNITPIEFPAALLADEQTRPWVKFWFNPAGSSRKTLGATNFIKRTTSIIQIDVWIPDIKSGPRLLNSFYDLVLSIFEFKQFYGFTTGGHTAADIDRPNWIGKAISFGARFDELIE